MALLRHGTLGVEFVPDWNSADIVPAVFGGLGLVHNLGDGQTAGVDYDYFVLEYDPNGNIVFRSHASGVDASAVVPVSLVRGTRYRICGRWTSLDGELDLAPGTLSVFISTTSGTTFTKGTDAVRATDPQRSPYGWIAVGGYAQSQLPQPAALKLWLKADSSVYKDFGVTLAVDGDPVAQWNDASGNGNNFNQVLINRPVFKTGIVNNKPVVRFTGGSSQYLTSSTSAGTFLSAMLGAGGVGHMFVVYNAASYVAGDPVLIDTNTVAGVVLATTSGGFAATGTFAFNISGGVAANQQQAAPAGTWTCVEWIHTAGSTLFSSISGTKSAGSSSGATDVLGLVWLGRRASLQNLTGDIAEVIVFNAEQTGATLAHVQEYIQHKYGIGFTNNPAPGIASKGLASGALSRLRISQHVLAADELARLFT